MPEFYDEKYLTTQGDTWDLISSAYYSTPFKISDLINANPQYAGILRFEAGIELDIPILAEESVESLPPWKRGAIL